MDTDRLNRWLTLGANVGVLIGIVLLVVELNQNREMMRAQTRNEMAMGLVEILSAPAATPQYASVIRRGYAGVELSADEYHQFYLRTIALFRLWENVHYQGRQGLFDESEFSKQKDAWRAYLDNSTPAMEIWCGFQGLASEEFVADVNASIADHACMSNE